MAKCIVETCSNVVAETAAFCQKPNCGKGTAGWESETGGQKFDQDKPRMDLLDPYAMEELAKVLTFGAKKYAPDNWRKGITYARLVAAALRHIFAFMLGQDKDPETELPHPAHAMCCMMFLVWMMKERPNLDDRYKKEKTNE